MCQFFKNNIYLEIMLKVIYMKLVTCRRKTYPNLNSVLPGNIGSKQPSEQKSLAIFNRSSGSGISDLINDWRRDSYRPNITCK